MKNKQHWLAIGSTALVTASLLLGCSHADKKQTAEAVAVASQDTAAEPVAKGKPGVSESELIVINAVVKAIDKKNRLVTLKFEDGKEKKVKCGPEVRNFPQIRVGDNVKVQFLESVELVVSDPGAKPSSEAEREVARAPLGGKPGIVAVDAVEVSATVQAIDYQTREVTLLGPEGKTVKVKAGPEVKRLEDVKRGDTVVARLTRAASIIVSTPEKSVKGK